MADTHGMPIMSVEFTNWRGERRRRKFMPTGKVEFGSTNIHPEPHYYMPVLDLEKNELRDCPLSGFHMETLQMERV